MTDPKDHLEQDPAEGSRETIERDLKKQNNKDETPKNTSDRRPSGDDAGAEAAEPSPGG